MPVNIHLIGKRALVGGSTAGIGKAAAFQLARNGAEVILIARNEARLKRTLDEMPATPDQKHGYLVADFSKPAQVEEKIQGYLRDNRSLDILVNNTGGPPGGPIFKAEPAAFQAAFEMHLLVNHILVQAVLPGMKRRQFGRIINVISTSVKQPLPNLGVSNTIRGAVGNWAKTLANELGGFGITVNNVLPGATETGRLTSILANKAEKLGIPVEEVVAEMKASIPAGRFGKPEEIAYAIAFLASEAAGYINGINVPVDGGRTGNL